MCEFMLPKRAYVALISIIMIQAELEVSSDLWQSIFTRRAERVNIIYIYICYSDLCYYFCSGAFGRAF